MQIKKVKVIYWGMEKIIWRKKIFNKINTKISFDNEAKKFIIKYPKSYNNYIYLNILIYFNNLINSNYIK